MTDPRRRAGLWRRHGTLLLVGIGLLVVLVFGVTLAAAIHVRGYGAADDAFISYRVAERVASGHGLRFNESGPRVEAASNFLFTMVLAGAQRLGLSIIRSSLALSVTCAGLTLVLLTWCIRRTTGPWGLWAPFALASMTIVCRNATNGLETTFFGLLLLTAVALYIHAERGPRGDRRALFLSSLVLAVLSMTRPEGPIYILALGVLRARDLHRRRHQGEALDLRAELWWALGFAAVYLPYTLWRAGYFGSLLPNTYYAKDLQFGGGLAKLGSGLLYLKLMFLSEPTLPLSLAAGAWAQLVAPSRRIRTLLTVVITQCVFMVLCGGDWPHMFEYGRFLYPALPMILWLLAEAGLVLLRLGRRRFFVSLAVALLALCQLNLVELVGVQLPPRFHVSRPYPLTRQVLHLAYVVKPRRLSWETWLARTTQTFAMERYHNNFDAIAGLWLRDRYGPKTRIASIQAGQFAFWSEMPFFDLFGLVTPDVAQLKRRHEPKPLFEALRRFDPDLIAFYKWGPGVHSRHLVLSGKLWDAGYGLRYVLQRGHARAFIIFEKGHRSIGDPREALFSSLADLPHRIPKDHWVAALER